MRGKLDSGAAGVEDHLELLEKEDGVSSVGDFLEKLSPLPQSPQPRLSQDSAGLRKLLRRELESLRVKLSPYVDEVHQEVGKHLDELRQQLQPVTEELLDQVSLRARQLRRQLLPSREVTAQLLEGADELQRFVAHYTDKIAFHTDQVKDIFQPYADRLLTEIHRNVQELHRSVAPHARTAPQQLNQHIQELSAKLARNARDLHSKIQSNLEQLKAKLSLYPGTLGGDPPGRYREALAREVQRRVEEFRRDTYIQIQAFARALDQETEEMRLKLSARPEEPEELQDAPPPPVEELRERLDALWKDLARSLGGDAGGGSRIPFFKEIIVSSFSCDSCSWSNTEIQSAGRIQEQGVCYTLAVTSRQDMNREVVKTDCATARIPELDFEIPAFTQKGVLTTIEGIIDRAVAGLEQDQPVRRATDEEVAKKIDEFIVKLRQLKEMNSPFTFIIDDPSGNSFVENPHAPRRDDALVVTHYRRTPQQAAMLGLEGEEVDAKPPDAVEDLRDEVLQFSTNCPECNAPANTNMKLVKSGGAIEPQGTRITLRITDPSDMTRDILKSETCSVEIPELEFELGMGALGGKFTTLEGLLKDIRDLVERNPFTLGDSSTPSRTGKLQGFIGKLQEIIDGKTKAHFIMDDPAGNSYLQNVYAPEEDPELRVERYERSFEQNEDLGLNDMKTEGYEPEAALGR
ncbi:zinc finger protein ZPR1 [Willisornis vidua]|uniref:Zinc finger protein ZPR1 n=1 Tax=Willisornis vidua TaxID=1566151 RepID=A0ABQ9DR44_9PASS|nr:zinc finger protein ZPR1 [Willisornis vidua]